MKPYNFTKIDIGLAAKTIQRTVEDFYCILPGTLPLETRRLPYPEARGVCFFIGKMFRYKTLFQIGAYFGKGDHSSVIRWCNVIDAAMQPLSNGVIPRPDLVKIINDILAVLNAYFNGTRLRLRRRRITYHHRVIRHKFRTVIMSKQAV